MSGLMARGRVGALAALSWACSCGPAASPARDAPAATEAQQTVRQPPVPPASAARPLQPAAAPASPEREVAASKSVETAAPACDFTIPQRFGDRVVSWEGDCEHQRAHGLGVLRANPKPGSQAQVLIFFGRLDHGQPKLGVIDTPDGYIAGELADGKELSNDDPNVTLRAFRAASAAASFVRDRLDAVGNAASAAFYTKKAEDLAAQIE